MTTNVTGEIAIKTEGGLAHFPGLAVAHAVSLDDLRPDEVQSVIDAVTETSFFDRPAETLLSRVRDGRLHHVSIIIGDRSRTLAIPDPSRDQALYRLFRLLQKLTDPARSRP